MEQHLETPTVEVAGATVSAALEAVFAGNPRLRGYLLDDQGQLRQHVVIFVDGERLHHRPDLERAVEENSEIYVIQALCDG